MGLFLLSGPKKSSMSHFSHILMFANSFPFCFKTLLRFLVLSVPLIAAQLTAAPVVSNLTASQRAGTKLVDIAYDLTATGFPAVAVSLEISSVGGAAWTVPTTSASGAIGSSLAPSTGKVIAWDAGADWSGGYSNQILTRRALHQPRARPHQQPLGLSPCPQLRPLEQQGSGMNGTQQQARNEFGANPEDSLGAFPPAFSARARRGLPALEGAGLSPLGLNWPLSRSPSFSERAKVQMRPLGAGRPAESRASDLGGDPLPSIHARPNLPRTA